MQEEAEQAVDRATSPETAVREKDVPFASGMVLSPHVIDLKPALGRRADAEIGFAQKMWNLSARLRRAFSPRAVDEHRHLVPGRVAFRLSPSTSGLPGRRPFFSAAPVVKKPAPDFRKLARAINLPIQDSGVPAIGAPKGLPVAKPSAAAPRPRNVDLSPKPRPKPAFFALPAGWHKHLAAFGALAAAFVLPIIVLAAYAGLAGDAKSIAERTGSALSDLKTASASAMSLNPSASDDFSRAADTFAETRGRLRGAAVQLAAFAAGQSGRLKSGDNALAAGESLSKAGAKLSSALEAFGSSTGTPLTERIKTFGSAVSAVIPDLDSANASLDKVSSSDVPKDYRQAFETIRSDLKTVAEDTRRFVSSSDALIGLLGAETKRRYLVIFQNADEIRPTGGFIGSFALMDVDRGKIAGIDVPPGGSYDLRGGLTERVAAPDQLRLVNPRWEFQDANWFADFPTSAKALIWFYGKSGGPSVDGVIAVDSNLMKDLLKVIGPVDLPEYGKTVTADNFTVETQKAVEIEYDRETNKPKQFIADLTPKVLQRLFEGGNAQLLQLMDAVGDAAARKDLMVYFTDADEQKAASSFGWTGEFKPVADGDFLSVVDTNIAGGKTDGVVNEDVSLSTAIGEDGSLTDTLTVRRTHNGVMGDLFTGVKNIDYLRVYVPAGSRLVSAEGFEAPAQSYFLPQDDTLKPSTLLAANEDTGAFVDDKSGTRVSGESGLTVFGNWIQIEPGESRSVRLSYVLPFKLGDLTSSPETRLEKLKRMLGAYVPTAKLQLVAQKQPGSVGRKFSASISLPSGWTALTRVPDAASIGDANLTYSGDFDQDLYLGTVLAKKN